MIKYIPFLFLPLISCQAQSEPEQKQVQVARTEEHLNRDSLEIMAFYEEHSKVTAESKSIGSVSGGSLENGKLMPFYGPNFTYFDQGSYFASRAYTSDGVKETILKTYAALHLAYPERKFFLMELSNHHGGKIYPHRTHQNGLSADFLMPKLKNGVANYDLDTLGQQHYFLDFNDKGQYKQDTTISIDFDLVAHHILLLNEEAKKLGHSIEKVIIKIEYKDELFATPHGKELKKSGIYIVQGLSPLINAIHDDHFHIDFKKGK